MAISSMIGDMILPFKRLFTEMIKEMIFPINVKNAKPKAAKKPICRKTKKISPKLIMPVRQESCILTFVNAYWVKRGDCRKLR